MSHLVIGLCARSVSRFFTELCRVVPKLSGERTRDKRTSLLCLVVPRVSSTTFHTTLACAMSRYSHSAFFCGHCKEFLGKSTFYKHKRRFYNVSSGTWQLAEAASTKTTTIPSSRSFDRNDMPFEDESSDLLEPSLREHEG